ncbi:MAG: serine/threonine-protein phosphatase [Myxococcales bacterium]|nr:serine/threonine-protein phosphatase [Myxococcales bacterium]
MFATAHAALDEVRTAAFATLPLSDEPTRHLEGAAVTHVGHVRAHNEDAWMASPSAGLFAVADGMGGHAAGEVASELCVKALSRLAQQPTRRTGQARALRGALEQAHADIVAEGRRDGSKAGMGTTAVALWLDGPRAVMAHVGDSRIYRLRHGMLERLTLDHSLLGDAVRAGWITPEQANRQPPTSVITRALGGAEAPVVELGATAVCPGDQFLLCSDGLTDLVPDMQIQRIMNRADSPAEAARQLSLAALDAGGLDNVTALVVQAG